jgi:pyridoxamine 5'-phosphate oxidase
MLEEAPGTDPIAVLAAWHAEARRAGAREPDAMSLATVGPTGRPAVRLVLVKGFADGEVAFVTNYASRKGREIDANPRVALGFFWVELGRQVRVEGVARRAPAAESDAYFATRPRESQLGAWASPQSEVIASRAVLEARYAEAEARFRGRDIERPAGWGIYRVRPEQVELWIGRPHRLHDRFSYTREAAGWAIARLSP